MPLNSSGPIDFNAIHVEAGGASAALGTINDADIRGLLRPVPSSGSEVKFSDYYGASRYVVDFSIHKPIFGAGYWNYGVGYGTHNVGNGSNWDFNTSSNNYGGGGSSTRVAKSAVTSPLLDANTTYEVDFDITVWGGDYFSSSIHFSFDTYQGRAPGFSNEQGLNSLNGISEVCQLLYVQDVSSQYAYDPTDLVYKGRHSGTRVFTMPSDIGAPAISMSQSGGIWVNSVTGAAQLLGGGGYCSVTVHSLTVKEL